MKQYKVKKSIVVPVMAAIIIAGMSSGVFYLQTASAATTLPRQITYGKRGLKKGGTVAGTVATINGTTITLTGRNATTYTVDATNAKIIKAPLPQTTIAITDIKIGDTIMVRGTVSGTSVTAINIIDGKFLPNAGVRRGQGLMGTVASVSGNTINLTGKNSKTYTVDATNAKIEKLPTITPGTTPTPGTRTMPTTITLSGIVTGDTLMVQGTVSGTSVTAINIIDGKFRNNKLK